ncbi:MAG: TauD/TfdA family dioxygenase [Pirellulaceae bacterium]
MSIFVPNPTAVETQQTFETSVFPYALVGQSPSVEVACNWIAEQRDELKRLATQHGAVLFRGFGLSSPEDFDQLVGALAVENFPYKRSLSNAVRVNFTERVFSANEAPSDVRIYLHHEMAQTPLFPTSILFFCQVAAVEGGATPLCRSDILYEQVRKACPEFIAKLESQGLKYTNVMPNDNDPQSGMGRSWRSTLGVADKQQAEERLQNLGYTFEWLEGDCLRATTPVLPGVREISPGRRTLFNQLIAAYSGWSDQRNDPSNAIRHGDNSKLDAQAVERLIQLADELTFEMAWQTGDAVLIDNTVAMHGRRPFVGTRKVLASLGDMQTHIFSPA